MTKKDDNRDWRYRKLIIGPAGSGKTNYLLNSIQKDNSIVDKIYLYAKDLEEPKYQLIINKREQARLKKNYKNAFIEYSNTMDDILRLKQKEKKKVLIVFDDMISHVSSNKKAQQVLKELLLHVEN